MDSKKLNKIELQLEQMLKHPKGIKSQELIAIAEKLGRKKVKRGKEPTYEREGSYPELIPPLSIPNHKGTELFGRTAKSIISTLLNDVSLWKFYLLEIKENGK